MCHRIVYVLLCIPRNPVIPLEVWCFRYLFGVQIPSQEVFGCRGDSKYLACYIVVHERSLLCDGQVST